MEQSKWFRVFSQCARCQQKFKAKTMVSCQQCKLIRYCSVMCMGVDKEFHKYVCGIAKMADFTKYEEELPTNSENESKTNENVAQKTKEFSSGQNDMAAEASAEGETTDEKMCTFCTKISSKLFVCSKCLNAKYCDKECQKQDFKWHKLLCFSSMKNEILNPYAKLKEIPKDFANLLPCARCQYLQPLQTMLLCKNCGVMPYCSKDCQRKDLLVHNLCCEILSVFEKVAEFIIGQFPPSRLQKYGFPQQRITNFYLSWIFNGGALSPIALLQIIGRYPFMFPAVIVQDGVKDKTHIVFHDVKSMANITIKHKDKTAEQKMSPLGDCLKPGNFILLTNVLWHVFTDGTQGLDVDDLDTVHFIHLD